jgi:hypothetical protein
MKRWRTRLLFLGGGAALIAAIPALSQQQTPEPLLPPGFGDPAAPLPPAEQPAPASKPLLPPTEGASTALLPPSETLADAGEDLDALAIPQPKAIEIPDSARRSTAIVGVLDESHWGLGESAFGTANGRFLSTLMRRLDAPLPSRWTSILLRRALLSQVRAPAYVSPVDWVAERAWLLLRMGEADGARMLIQSVDVDQFTPKMFAVAVQTALATADPAALCPLVGPGQQISDEPVWPLADAMCSALQGDAGRASALIDQARHRGVASGIDLLLAEKVIGAGINTRRAVTIQWDNVDGLNSWRFGLASATGLQIPDRLMGQAGKHVLAWQARAPMLPIEDRLSAAQTAASLGVFSNASLVEIYSLIADTTDPSEISESVGGRLRRAYVAPHMSDRMDALHSLWKDEAGTETARHARLILTAVAASRIPPSGQFADDAGQLIASMLTAGFDRQAARWANVVATGKGGSDLGWSLLAVASPGLNVDVSAGRIRDFEQRDDSPDKVRTRLLVAALAGLDRIPAGTQARFADSLSIPFDRRNRWTVLIDRAAEKQQPGTVALLAGVGMQTSDWRGVPPDYLYRILRALRAVGHDYEARMIAAEALSRL